MEVHVSHRHDCWDDAMEDCVEEEIARIEDHLDRAGVRPTTLHLSVTRSGHQRTECSVHLHVPGLVLPARGASLRMNDAVRCAIDELLKQVERHERMGDGTFGKSGG